MKNLFRIVFCMALFAQPVFAESELSKAVADVSDNATKTPEGLFSTQQLKNLEEKVEPHIGQYGRSDLGGSNYYNALNNLFINNSSKFYSNIVNLGVNLSFKKKKSTFSLSSENGANKISFQLAIIEDRYRIIFSADKISNNKALLFCDRIARGVMGISQKTMHAAEVIRGANSKALGVAVKIHGLSVEEIEEVIVQVAKRVEHY